MKQLDYFLNVNKVDRSIFQIIFWWESRRLLYNLIALFFGIISLSIMLLISMGSSKGGPDNFMIVFVFPILCNVAYTFGWITELLSPRNINYGPRMFKTGLSITLIFICLPTILWVIVDIIDFIRRIL